MDIDQYRYHEKDQFNRISSLLAANRLRFGRRKSANQDEIYDEDAHLAVEEEEVLGNFIF